ncbi:hypothetical protein ACFP65_00250 [Marinilactibacillus sp. GCM10026970]|uniref:hypothetical protein n=1 Tax=Marinilactibacillus sp. GCM10026970 TaxID=3252642 RepID=UPI00361891DD
MIKQFLSYYLNNMTFIFSVIVLSVTLLSVMNILEVGDMTIFILTTAIFTLGLSLISYGISHFNFKSNFAFHVANCATQFGGLLLIGRLLGYMPTLEGVLFNIVIFSSVYALSVRKRKFELEQLAAAMNERLGE